MNSDKISSDSDSFRSSCPGRRFTGNSGFTIIELLAVSGMLGLLACTVIPTLGRTKPSAQGVVCLNNVRQLMAAVTLYTQDNHDLFPPNPDDGTTIPGYNWCTGQAGIGGADEFNPDLLRDPKRTLVAPYLRGGISVFHCTADARRGNYDGAGLYPGSPLKGTQVAAARSVSMNHAVGTIDPAFSGGFGHAGVPNLAVNGPWLTGIHGANNAQTGPYRTYGKTAQMVAPTPSNLWVITEESPFSINDAAFASSVGSSIWIDYVSTLHNSGCTLAFGDGHAELHRWVDPTTGLVGAPSQRVVPSDDADWHWLVARTSSKMR